MTQWELLDAIAWREAVMEVGAEAGIRAALELIDDHNPRLNAFSVVLREEALATARSLDAAGLSDAPSMPLWGVPVAIKEEVDVAGCVTTFGTQANHTPKERDSEIVTRLRRAGAIIVGKTTMPAFGAFPFTESEATGITRNPHDLRRSPGGSSGGSAAAVAAGLVPVAIGGDGGGSIRIPAAHTGLVGLKPRRGVIPTAPYPHLWRELGTSGALTRSVRDAHLLYEVLSGESHPSAPAVSVPRSLRIGVDTTPVSPLTPPHKSHLSAVERARAQLAGLGHHVETTKVDTIDPTPGFMCQFLASVREEITGLERPELIESRHKRTKSLGSLVTPGMLRWAAQRGEKLSAQLEDYFSEFDLLLTPTVAARPAKAEVLTGKGTVAAQLASLPHVAYTAKYNVSGHPAIAIPFGVGKDGLPISIQLVASRQQGEWLLLDVAEQLLPSQRS